MTSHDNTSLPIASYNSQNDTATAGVMSGADAKKLAGVGTYTHLYHPGNGGGHTDTWWADLNEVYLQYLCTNPVTGSSKEHDHSDSTTSPIPVASDSQAGIITAETYRKLMVLLADVEDPDPPTSDVEDSDPPVSAG